MKVADGFWLSKKGYEVNYASQAYKVETTENAIKVLATPYTVMNRGMTLGGPNLEITYSSTCENTIKVHIDHYRGGLDNIPRFELNEDPNFKPVINRSEDSVELISGDTKVVIRIADDWDVQFYYKDRHLTGGAWRSTSIIHENQFHANARMELQEDDQDFNYPQDPNRTYIREQLKTDIGECIYGFGEKFTPFVKNGQVVEIWNSDGGTCSDQSYKNIPFYVSSKSYGVFVNSSDKVSFEVNSDTVSKVTFTQPGEELEYFIIGGENLEDVLKHYTDLTGKPSLPPAYTFGLWLSTSFTTSYDEETVTSFIDGMKDRKIPLQVFHFDCFWMKEYEWCNFEWDKDMFPDPEGMLKRLHDKGLEICVWINSYVGQQSKLFDIGKEKGYFIKNLDGSVYQSDMWQPGMAIVDFTNPEACEWFKGLLKKLFDMGVNNIKTDFGERIPTKVKYFNGKDPIKMHNYYTYLYNKCVFEALEEYYGKDKACLFARSATVGGQKFPVHWGGDCYAEYSAMSETLRGGLSLCSSGFGFFSHDMGGFEATAPADVYKRWCAFGLLSTHSRLHGSTSYRVPWVYDEDGDTEACDVLRHYTVLKGRLMPYLWAQANKTHTEGVPMMRSMIIAFSDDTACKYLDQQYMLGDNLCIVIDSNIVIIAAAGNTAGTHATCNNSCVAGHAAADGQDALRNLHADDIFGAGFQTDQNDLLPSFVLDLLFSIFSAEDNATAGRSRRSGQALADCFSSLQGSSVKLRVQQGIQLLGLNAQYSGALIDNALINEVAGDLQSSLCGTLAVTGLQHIQVAVLNGELHILHIAEVVLQTGSDLNELVVDLRHLLVQVADGRRSADTSNDVLALCIDEVLAHQLLSAGGGVTGECNAGAGAVAGVTESHLLDVDSGAPLVGDLVHLTIDVCAGVVPAAEDGLDSLDELILGVLGEGSALVVLIDLLEGADQFLQVVSSQVNVVLDALGFLHLVDLDLEQALRDHHNDVREHLHKATVAVVCKTGVAGLLCQTFKPACTGFCRSSCGQSPFHLQPQFLFTD